MLAMPAHPELLSWARRESGFELFRVAKRLNVKPEKVEAWEVGEKQPTLRQIENLARFFHRPLSVFFLPQPPQLPPLAAEYRRLPNVVPGHESPELRLSLRQMLARRFRITPLAMATRLRESGYMDWARYQTWKQDWDHYITTLPERSKGFATPVSKALGRNGRPFTQLVLEALSANRITPVAAARYLELRFEHFDKLRTAIWEGSTAMMGDD